ncbi:MAG: hypothetical protein ACE5GX_10850 [Thermoanaerobaculia bacterium]
MMRSRIAILLGLAAIPPAALAADVDGLLRIHPDNPRYLTNNSGEAILLVGPHTWHVFQDYDDGKDSTDFDYQAWLDELKQDGFTFFRGWSWSDGYYSPLPFEEVIVQGRRVYDLTRWDERYFNRLRRRLKAAADHGLYTSVLLFQQWSVDDGEGRRRPNPWAVHPLNRSNNIQRLNKRNQSGARLAPIHAEYLRRMVDALYELDNFVWEVGNELDGSAGSWVRLVVDRLRELEDEKIASDPADRNRRHLIWASCVGGREMPGPAYGADLMSPCRTQRYGVETGSDCFEVSLPAKPPAADGSKVVVADSDHLSPLASDPDWAWKSFFRGLHPIALTIPDGRDSLPWWRGGCDLDRGRAPTARLQRTLATIARVARKIDVAELVPQSKTRPGHPDTFASSGYALFSAKKPGSSKKPDGKRYLVYQPESSVGIRPVTVCGLRQSRSYKVLWRRLDNGDVFWRARRNSVRGCEVFNGSARGGVLELTLK